MGEPTEHRARSARRRSNSSERLLESPPISHCAAAAGGENAAAAASGGAHHQEVTAAGAKKKAAVAVGRDGPSSPAASAEGSGGEGRGVPWCFVGRLLSNKVSSVGAACTEGETSSLEVEEEEELPEREEKNMPKQKKKWSWLPDPEKRWPVQGW